MDPHSGKLYKSLDEAFAAGVYDAVEVSGSPESVRRVSEAVKAQAKARRKAQRKSRRANRG